MKEVLCKTCCYWVDCKDKGFCILQDLYTYTEKTRCIDYEKGEPIPEKEYDDAQYGCLD